MEQEPQFDIFIVDGSIDFIAIKKGYCRNCIDKKLSDAYNGLKVLHIMKESISGRKYINMKKDGLKGLNVACSC